MSKFGVLFTPTSILGKFVRDAFWIAVAGSGGLLINDWTGVTGAVNDATGDKIPQVFLALAFGGVLAAVRIARKHVQTGSTPAPVPDPPILPAPPAP